MNFKVEYDNDKNYILQLGDILISNDNELCSVIAKYHNGEPVQYYIRGLFSSHGICNLSSYTLGDLTDKARHFGYTIFSKDNYNLVLRKISD